MKTDLAELAICGGPPAFSEIRHVGRPNIGDPDRFLGLARQVLDRRWLSNSGPCVENLEWRLREFFGAEHCECVSNATDGLIVAIRALGLAGEVIVPSFTFIATAHVVQWLGLTPVFCDIDPRTHCIDPAKAEMLITPRTSAIIAVHLWGRPCAVAALEELARRHGLKLIFDSAHAFGCSHENRMLGNFGDAEVFSFHATKVFNTGEGGAVVTNDHELAKRVRSMRNFGFSGMDTTEGPGINAKMPELSAAMGLNNLESFPEFVRTNHSNYACYDEGLSGVPGVKLLEYNHFERNNYHYIVLSIDETLSVLSRDYLQQILWAENILARRYFYPGCHRMAPYFKAGISGSSRLPVTEALSERVLALPNGTAVSPSDVREICAVVRLSIAHGDELAHRLQGRISAAHA
ncbi:MAG TPA: DegT/DnrJ/EryC1/StrS family aminotransferase [Terriglobales bacterium]|nr:DegT/DnrJ/EryC1/StrS family aminotransferase [Terriglobales bacterium]